MPNFNIINKIPVCNDYDISKKELQQGIFVSEETISKIQRCMENILLRKQEGGIKFYNSQQSHRVFELDTDLGLIFKVDRYVVSKDSSSNSRYQNMIYAQTVIRTHQLALLVIPKAKLFTINLEDKKYEIIAEQKMDINPHESAQEQYFLDYSDSLNETIRQLALFICKTGYSDVEWRNNPILNNSFDGRNRKIALVDLEEMRSPSDGLFGGAFGRRGLVGCVNEEQGKRIETIAKENDISISFFEDAYSQRKEELEEGRNLKEYYMKKGIIEGNEPIKIDDNALDFFTDAKKTREKLKRLTLDLIEAINIKIANSLAEESIKGRRYIYIDTNRGTFSGMDNRLVDPGENEYETARAFKTDKEYYDATFLGCIVKKLKDLDAIYKLDKRNGHGYYIQA